MGHRKLRIGHWSVKLDRRRVAARLRLFALMVAVLPW
jgi:hypothetical protein